MRGCRQRGRYASGRPADFCPREGPSPRFRVRAAALTYFCPRGAVCAALAEFGLPDDAARRAEAALCYGKIKTEALLTNWRKFVLREGRFIPNVYECVRPVACDLKFYAMREELAKKRGFAWKRR